LQVGGSMKQSKGDQAWVALSEIRHEIRAYKKHDVGTADDLIDRINHITMEAESWIGA